MKLEDLDRNFAVQTEIDEPDLVWLNVRSAPFAVYGLLYDEAAGRFTRMPKDAAQAVSAGVAELCVDTAGGRVRFRTDSAAIAIRVVTHNRHAMNKMARTGQSGFDLYQDIDGELLFKQTFIPPADLTDGYCSLAKTDGVLRDYMIHFPLYDGVNELFIGLKEDCILEAPTPYADALPVVYYGSSITQGACASHPGNAYEAQIARWIDRDFVNLGFAGSAKGEQAMAKYLASLSMSAFVCDFDYNCKSADELRAVHEPLIRTVRAAHPDLPIVLVSGPRAIRGEKAFLDRRQVVVDTYEKLIAEGDRNVYFVDGRTLFEGVNWDLCTVDMTHPNDLGLFRMAQKIGEPLIKIFAE